MRAFAESEVRIRRSRERNRNHRCARHGRQTPRLRRHWLSSLYSMCNASVHPSLCVSVQISVHLSIIPSISRRELVLLVCVCVSDRVYSSPCRAVASHIHGQIIIIHCSLRFGDGRSSAVVCASQFFSSPVVVSRASEEEICCVYYSLTTLAALFAEAHPSS